jgi:hypothetical protein
MIKVFIRSNDFNDLFDRFKSDEDLKLNVYHNLFKSEQVIIVVLREPNDSLEYAEGFIKKLVSSNRLLVKEYSDDMDDFDMYNNSSRGIVFHRGSSEYINNSTKRSALIYINVESNLDILARTEPLFKEYAIDTSQERGIGLIRGLPINTIVYQDNYFLKTSTDIHMATNQVIRNIDKLFGDFIKNNACNFYDGTLYIDFIYGQINEALTEEKFKGILSKVKNEVSSKYKKYGVDVYCSFTKGKLNPHARIMISDYFLAHAGEEFYHNNTQIMANGILKQPDSYKLLFKRLVGELAKVDHMKILTP